MPMFGSSKKHDNDTAVSDIMDSNTTGGGRHHAAHPTNQAPTNDYPAQAPGGGMGNANTFGQTHTQSGPGGAPYDNTNFQQQTGPGQHGQHAAFAQDDPYTAGGVGAGHQGGGRGIPPTGALDHGASSNQSGSSGGAGGRLAGKIETAIGTIVGSDALKAKGAQKQNEANSIKLQGRELAEAERLEREAVMRRERAVAHGAHPANSALGAGNPGAGSMGAGNPGVGTGHGPGLF